MKKSPLVIIALTAVVAVGFYFQREAANQQGVPSAEQEEELAAAENPSATQDNDVITPLTDYQAQLAAWDGETRLINFWATWCAPCRREIPLLKKLHGEKEQKQVQVIGIAVDVMEDVLAYAEEAQFNYPVLVGQEVAMDAAASSGVDFIGLPFTLVMSGNGDLVATHVGEIRQEHLDRVVAVMHELESGAVDLDAARRALHTLGTDAG